MTNLLATSPDWALFVLRLALAIAIFPHGAQKVLGWFGGYGFKGTMGFFTGTLKIPAALATLAIAAEFLGSLGLVVGLLTRLAALGILAVLVVAAVMVHRPYGFFLNWTGQQKGEGIEFHIVASAIAFALILDGGGVLSLDGWLTGT